MLIKFDLNKDDKSFNFYQAAERLKKKHLKIYKKYQNDLDGILRYMNLRNEFTHEKLNLTQRDHILDENTDFSMKEGIEWGEKERYESAIEQYKFLPRLAEVVSEMIDLQQ